MGSRVVLLGELLILVYGDFAASYASTKDVYATLKALPRTAFAAGLVWAILFFLADVGEGGAAAFFGLLIVSGYWLVQGPSIANSLETLVALGGMA